MFEIGNSLREARLRREIDSPRPSRRPRSARKYLTRARGGAFDALPAQTYVKGFLRTYADYLGLDGQLYVDEYNSRYSAGGEESREPVVARRTAGVSSPHRRLERRASCSFALAGIGILFALLIAAFRFGGHDNPGSQIPNLGPSTPKAHAKTKTTTTHKAVVRPARPAKFRFFVVSTSGNCWMEVRNYSVNGRTLYAGTLQLHQSQRFVARRLWIDFGSPGERERVRERAGGHDPGRRSHGDRAGHAPRDRPGTEDRLTRPRGVVVVTGSELVRGERTDRNGPFLAAELMRLGIEPARIAIVGDDAGELEARAAGGAARPTCASSRAGSGRHTTTARWRCSPASPGSSWRSILSSRPRSKGFLGRSPSG